MCANTFPQLRNEADYDGPNPLVVYKAPVPRFFSQILISNLHFIPDHFLTILQAPKDLCILNHTLMVLQSPRTNIPLNPPPKICREPGVPPLATLERMFPTESNLDELDLQLLLAKVDMMISVCYRLLGA